MKNINIKLFVWVILAISLILLFILAYFKGIAEVNLWNLIKILPMVVTLDMIMITLFVKWGWRVKLLKEWFVPFPDLNGTWLGYIQTNWTNPGTGEKPGSIPVILTIKQSFMQISCVMRTAEMTSYSIVEDFNIDENRQIKQLAYIYTSKPTLAVADRSAPHNGSIILDIIGKPVEKLKGQYWTDRKSTGEIVLNLREKKLLYEMPDTK